MIFETEHVAFYGALVSTFSLFLALLSLVLQAISVYRDRKSVKICFSKDNEIFSTGDTFNPYKEGVDYLEIVVINKGRRPVNITSLGLCYYRGSCTKSKILPVDAIKKGEFKLSEGERERFYIEQSKIDFKKLHYFFAKDSIGKEYVLFYHNLIFRFFKKLFYFCKR